MCKILNEAVPAGEYVVAIHLLYHACLFQALLSGLSAGRMGETSLAAGVKHSCIMLIIALVVFSFIIIV